MSLFLRTRPTSEMLLLSVFREDTSLRSTQSRRNRQTTDDDERSSALWVGYKFCGYTQELKHIRSWRCQYKLKSQVPVPRYRGRSRRRCKMPHSIPASF